MKSLFLALVVLISFPLSAQKWELFTSTKGAFSANFPAKPDVTDVTRQTEDGFSVTAYLHMMHKEPVTAFVIFNELENGVNIEDDSIYLNSVADNMLSKLLQDKLGTDKPDVDDFVFEGYPGKSMDVLTNSSIGEIRVILRSNRVYIIAGIFPKKQKKELEKFLSSFKFLPYQPTKFETYSVAKGLKLDLPSKPVLDEESSTLGDGSEVYYAQDPNSGDSYSILISPASKYDQFESDTSFIQARLEAFKSYNEADENVENFSKIDNRLAGELTTIARRQYVASRYLSFYRGDVGFMIMTTGHPSNVKNATAQRIFGSIKFEGTPSGNLFSDKSSLILKDLSNPDTAIANGAKNAMMTTEFSEKNLEEIKHYLEKKYADDSDLHNSRRELLLDALKKLEDESSIAFIEKIFPSLKGNANQELSAASVLASLKTRRALDARIKLLDKLTYHEELLYYPVLGVYTVDSADQKYFFEKTSHLLKTKPCKLSLYYFMKHLLEQKRLTLKEIASWRAMINTDFDTEIVTYKSDSTYKNLDDFIIIMKHYESLDKKQVASLKEVASGYDTELSILANVTLLKHKQQVPANQLVEIAKNHVARIRMYDEFEKASLLQHFPKLYLNQDSLAMSQVYSYAEEDEFWPAKVEMAYQGLEQYNGATMKFYVFRVYDGEIWYRSIFGPFDPNKLSTWGELNYIDFEAEDPKEDYKQYLHDVIEASTVVEEE